MVVEIPDKCLPHPSTICSCMMHSSGKWWDYHCASLQVSITAVSGSISDLFLMHLSLTCRRLEAQRRKERQEAHLYVTVDVSAFILT